MLSKAFAVDYVDVDCNRVSVLKKVAGVACRRPGGRNYSRTLAIIQGSGKSRTMLEIALDVPTMYFCFREPGQAGFPPATPSVLSWIAECEKSVFAV